jgi:hypothetical protein
VPIWAAPGEQKKERAREMQKKKEDKKATGRELEQKKHSSK